MPTLTDLTEEHREFIRRCVQREIQETLAPVMDHLRALNAAIRGLVESLQSQARDTDDLNQEVHGLRVMISDILDATDTANRN